ncbi:MAG: hypothetical protein ACI319_10030 [Holdemanella porci]
MKNKILFSILVILFVSICIINFNYINSNKEKESYTYIICDEDDPSTTLALFNIHFKNNENISQMKLYVKYDNNVLRYISEDELIYRSNIIKDIKISNESYELEYFLKSIPYGKMMYYEKMSIDLSNSSIENDIDLFNYLGLSKYIKNNNLIFKIEDIANDSSFPYRWIIENGEMTCTSYNSK